MQLDQITSELLLKLKAQGYNKNRLTWYKSDKELTVVFAIQKSAYGADLWYYCFGICINALKPECKVISHCQIQHRIDMSYNGHNWTPDEILTLLGKWVSMYGSMTELRTKAIEGNLPSYCTREALRYLTTVAFH